MAPVYSLDCPECCGDCPYSVVIRVDLDMQSGNAFLILSENGGIIIQGGGTLIFDAGGGFEVLFAIGARADYNGAGTLTVHFFHNNQWNHVQFTNVTTEEVPENNRRNYIGNNCVIIEE